MFRGEEGFPLVHRSTLGIPPPPRRRATFAKRHRGADDAARKDTFLLWPSLNARIAIGLIAASNMTIGRAGHSNVSASERRMVLLQLATALLSRY